MAYFAVQQIPYSEVRRRLPLYPITRALRATVAGPAFGSVAALLTGAVIASGCASDKPFAKVNGQVITRDEYVKALEQQQVVVPGGPPSNAEKLVLDQLVGNKILLGEAAKINAVPTEDEVNRYYELQRKMFEGQYPGKSYEAAMKEMGTAPEQLKAVMKVQLAEATLYSRELGVTDAEIRQAYDAARGMVGLPARVQLRLILVAPNSPEFQQAKKLLEVKKPFDEVAKQINPPQFKANGGLLPQTTAINQIGLDYQSKVQQSVDGAWFGPVDFRLSQTQPPAKAWVKIEKKFPAYTVNYEDAAPLVRRQLVEQKLTQPANAKVRDRIMKLKLDAKFEPQDSTYAVVWDSLRKNAMDAGIGQLAGAATPVVGGGAVSAPAGAPAAGGNGASAKAVSSSLDGSKP
jgi:hypothetical protein